MTDDPFAPKPADQKREERERAVEILYEAEVKGVLAEEILESQVVALGAAVGELVKGVSEDVEAIDAEIDAYLNEGWALDRLGILDLWILRLGVFELMSQRAPIAVVINEAVELGNRFGATDESGRFINGVLGSVARELK